VIEYLRNNYIEKVPLIGCEERVTIGVLPYICLKQQIDEKAAARRTGSTVSLTGQPIGGRKRGGGSALGEMEVNALMAYGASGILYERLAKQTDLVETLICPQCRMINQIGDICPKCKCQTTRTKIRKPFISFVNILTSLGISTII
jgi:DNA-directed RNA polymerase beta subunit